MNKVRLTYEPPVKLSNDLLAKADNRFITRLDKIPFKNKAHLWTEVSFDQRNGYISQTERLCVEAYCCGFLTYYDQVVRSRMHKFKFIYFEWKDIKGETPYTFLSVYLDPAPKKKDIAHSYPGYAGFFRSSQASVPATTTHGLK